MNTSVLNTDRSENTLHEKMPRGLGEQEMKSKPGKSRAEGSGFQKRCRHLKF